MSKGTSHIGPTILKSFFGSSPFFPHLSGCFFRIFLTIVNHPYISLLLASANLLGILGLPLAVTCLEVRVVEGPITLGIADLIEDVPHVAEVGVVVVETETL